MRAVYGNPFTEKPRCEIPLSFTYFTAITAVAAALKRNISLPCGIFNVYPAIWVLLIAPTGRGRKTTAAEIMASILREAGVCKILAEDLTPEYLVLALTRKKLELSKIGPGSEVVQLTLDSCALAYAPEFSDFLSSRDYNSALVKRLTRLADSPAIWKSGRISRGEIELTNVALTLLGASNPVWLTCIPGDAHGGGFVARMLQIVSTGATKPVATPKGLLVEERDALVSGIREIATLAGEARLTEPTDEQFTRWYEKFFYEFSPEEKRAAYQARKHIHLLRLAMIHAASEMRLSVTLDDLTRSMKLLDAIEEPMFEIYDEMDRRSTVEGATIDMIMGIIRRRDRISRTDLLRRCVAKGVHADVVDVCLRSLMESELVTEEAIRQSKGGRPGRFYIYGRKNQQNPVDNSAEG